LFAAVAAGVAAVLLAALFVPWQVDILAFWDGVAVTFLGVIRYQIGRLDAAATERIAVQEDDTRTMARLIVVTAATVSLIGVGLTLLKASQQGGPAQFALTVVAVVTIVLSWAVVHTSYVLRYAHLYYNPPRGGVDFHEDNPDYREFAYLAFTVGMTFQVSDTDIQKRPIRRAIIGHALLSYMFGVVIIGAAANIVAGFLRAPRHPTAGARQVNSPIPLGIMNKSVNDLLGHLEGHGNLERVPGSADGRARLIQLTLKNQQLPETI
jgi:uncharacterized membrane protein